MYRAATSLKASRSRSLGFLPFVAGALLLLGGPGPNASLALFAVTILVIGVALLWRPGESPILLFVFVYPWIQAAAPIFHANWLGLELADYPRVKGDIERSIVLTLLGLLCISAGMRLAAGRWDSRIGMRARALALSRPIAIWFKLYVQFTVVSVAVLAIGGVAAPGLMQIWLAIAALRWAFFYLFAYAGFLRPVASRHYLYGAFLFELVISIGGFFSEFKTVFFFLLIAMIASNTRMTARAMLGIAGVSAMLLCLGVVWMAIKKDYRAYVSGGTSAQIVAVGVAERWSKLVELVEGLDDAALAAGADQMVRRLSYVEFFGIVLNRVPDITPHENGAIWFDALSRPFMPRVLFPSKTEINDSERTDYYTGGMSGGYENTSVSLGYVAESYIDFGVSGMMACLFMFGYVLGQVYRTLLSWRATKGLLGMALATGVLFGMSVLESSITKTLGGFGASLLAAWLIGKWGVPKWCPWAVDDRA